MHMIDRSAPLFFTCVQGMHIPATPQLVADVLKVPRVKFPDYPSCERLRTVSKNELMSVFYERPVLFQLLLGLCKRPVVFKHGDDLCTLSSLVLQLHYRVSCSFLVISL